MCTCIFVFKSLFRRIKFYFDSTRLFFIFLFFIFKQEKCLLLRTFCIDRIAPCQRSSSYFIYSLTFLFYLIKTNFFQLLFLFYQVKLRSRFFFPSVSGWKMRCSKVLVIISCLVSSALAVCVRQPIANQSVALKSPGDNGFHIRINGDPDRYIPGSSYVCKLFFFF